MNDPYEIVLSKLNSLGCNPRKMGNGYIANCPAHEDKIASLKIDQGTKKVLLECHANCHYDAVVEALGMEKVDFYYERQEKQGYQRKNPSEKKKPAKAGNYLDNILDNPDLSSVRNYTSLEDYAIFKGFNPEVFTNAGVYESTKDDKPTIVFPTKNGNRHRFLSGKTDDSTPKFKADIGFSACWYKLDEALKITREKELSVLIICNGEPSTVLAQHCGLPACCISGGEGKNLKDDIASELKSGILALGGNLSDITIMVTYDVDEPGIKAALKLVKQLIDYGFKSKAVKFIDNVFKGYDLADFVKTNKSHSYRLLMNLPVLEEDVIKENIINQNGHKTNKTNPLNPNNPNKPQIYTDDHEFIVFGKAREVFAANNSLPKWYIKQGKLVRLTLKDKGLPGGFLEVPDQEMLLDHLVDSASWVKTTKTGQAPSKLDYKVAKNMAVNLPKVPFIDQVSPIPIFTRSGQVLSQFGYNAEESVFIASSKERQENKFDFRIFIPTYQQVEQAKQVIYDEWLGNFPFIDDIERTNILAPILTPFLRKLIKGLTPLFLIEAPERGTGKTLLASTIAMVATAKAAQVKAYPTKEDEIRKVITTELMAGETVIFFDNINGVLNSDALATVLTSNVWSDRILGGNKSLCANTDILWLATGNNVTLGVDFIRRTIKIRLDANTQKPWTRQGFTHTDLITWVEINRERITDACLTIIKHWVDGGQKVTNNIALGSFQSFANIVGSILNNAGLYGFLGKMDQMEDDSLFDVEWQEFVDAWWSAYGETPQRTIDLFNLCNNTNHQLMTIVRQDRSESSQQTRLGNAVKKAKGRIVNGLKITLAKVHSEGHGDRPGYCLKPVKD